MLPKNNQPQNNAQKKVEGALDFNSRCIAAVHEYRECEAAKEPNLSDKKAKQKEVPPLQNGHHFRYPRMDAWVSVRPQGDRSLEEPGSGGG